MVNTVLYPYGTDDIVTALFLVLIWILYKRISKWFFIIILFYEAFSISLFILTHFPPPNLHYLGVDKPLDNWLLLSSSWVEQENIWQPWNENSYVWAFCVFTKDTTIWMWKRSSLESYCMLSHEVQKLKYDILIACIVLLLCCWWFYIIVFVFLNCTWPWVFLRCKANYI